MNVQLLSEICKTPGAPGYESRIRALILKEITPYVDDLRIDSMGNILATVNGKEDKTIMSTAHMDEIGFMVQHIDENGFIRFQTLGGFDPKTHTAQRVIIHGKKDIVGVMGCKPIHVMSAEERNKVLKNTDYFIDTGMPYDEVVKWIEPGNPITRQRELIEMGDCVNCKSLDNRVSVYILIEALKSMRDKMPPYNFVAAFTVQEEVGLRGATTAAHQINPHFGINLDVTIAYDLPGAQPHEMITELGKGVAIKMYDGRTICDYRMVEFMKKTAEKHDIKWQPEILFAGGTDTAELQRAGKHGSIAGALSIPTRNLHQVIEMCHKKDIQDTIDLLTACIYDIPNFRWSH